MPRMDKLSTYRTTVTATKGAVMVVYAGTLIVDLDRAGTVTLDNGGWFTVTTKRKMCQASNQFGLGFWVFQKKGEWFVNIYDGEDRKILPYKNGMKFPAAPL